VVYAAGTPKGDTISYDEQLEIDVTMGNQTTASIRQLNTHDVAADALAERIGGMPNQCVIDKLYEYSARYGVEVIIDTNPLGVTNN